ncbi:MAG: HepT-like ribonuclease domain-containing protein [Acidimicrobiales bacterium]
MNDPRRRLDDILARCDDAARLVVRGRDAFEGDVILRHAAKSIIADIGEAGKNLEALADQGPGVPWAQIARMRDRVAHRYFDVDYDVVWDTLTTDLPALERAVRAFVEHNDG